MPPKKNNKKGKKGGDDDEEYWAQKEAALASPAPEAQEAEDEEEGGGLMSRMRKSKKKRNNFADLDLEDDAESKPAGIEEVRANPDDEWPEEDVKPKKGKKGKKAKKQEVDSEEEEAEIAKPAERADLDDEWPEEDVKPKKGKKGKKSKAHTPADSDDEEVVEAKAEDVAEVMAAPVKEEKPAPAEKEADEKDSDNEGPKLLTKKEKEKLKKEKEKEKKKAQAAAKRAAAGDSAPAAPSAPTPPADSAPAPGDDAEEDDVDADDATAADKKKKKKKKAAPKVEAPPAPAKGKKVPAHIAAMQAAVAEKKRIEEEAAAAEAERQRILAEEDARIEEEEAKIEAQKAAKKAKEKERLERLKKEGKLLTPAEKQKRAVAEARKQAMLDAGVKVAGLQEGGAVVKKPFNKKKAPPKPKAPAPAAASSTPAPAPEPEATPEPAAAPKAEESEDDWDKSDEDTTPVGQLADDVKGLKVEDSGDDWDKSEDEAPVKTPATPSAEAKSSVSKQAAPLKQVATAPAATAPAATAPAAAAASISKPAANGKTSTAAPAKPADDDESSDDDSDDSDEESDSESDSSADSEDERIEAGRVSYMKRRDAAIKASEGNSELRSPICCILGHVDHGKTRLLDKIRQTSVAEGEAGGITQQIGATFFPSEAIISKSNIVNVDNYEVKIPGLLIIDTPGHEAFANLRTRGSSLCNIAILVVDITQSFEKQTFESLELLKKGKTPFVVALNKIDRLYGWKATPDNGFRASYEQQSKSVKSEFENRLQEVKLKLAEAGLNSELFDENKKLGSVVSLVPTSAFTGEGIPDMLLLLAKLTQERMNKSLMYISDLSCTVLEVKNVEGMGTTLDVILSNGHLKYGDTIVLCGTDGPIITKVRALLTPQPMRELRIKSTYVKHDTVKAALGVKIFAPGLEKAIAGARLYVAENEDEESYFSDICMDDLQTLKRFAVDAKGKGVYVQASTLGALEALLTFLQSNKVPIHDFGVGPVFAKTIRGHHMMAERAPEYACILAFDVSIDPEATKAAAAAGLKIFTAPVIYHLFDAFKKYLAEVIEARKRDAMDSAVWPVRLSIIQAFAMRDPIILGCDITEGTLRVGTPVGVVKYDKATKVREIIKLGKITSLEKEHKSVDLVKKTAVGGGITVKIERAPWETAKMFGRHFTLEDEVVSLISRKSIDTLKNVFRDQVTKDEWLMIRKMKDEQGIQ